MDSALGKLFTILLFIVLAVPLGSIYNGNILQDLWLWFIVPLGVPPVGLAHAMGLSSFASFFTVGLSVALTGKAEKDSKLEESTKMWAVWGVSMFVFSCVWGWAAIVHSFM